MVAWNPIELKAETRNISKYNNKLLFHLKKKKNVNFTVNPAKNGGVKERRVKGNGRKPQRCQEKTKTVSFERPKCWENKRTAFELNHAVLFD